VTSAFERYQQGSLPSSEALLLPQPEPAPMIETWNQRNWALSYPDRARRRVFELVSAMLEPSDRHITFVEDNVYVVSFHYVLGNWKALVSTSLPDGMYYEVTYDSARGATYITSYKQWAHVNISDEEA
jgi:hypothetical protein